MFLFRHLENNDNSSKFFKKRPAAMGWDYILEPVNSDVKFQNIYIYKTNSVSKDRGPLENG